jgi:hypothetical protein
MENQNVSQSQQKLDVNAISQQASTQIVKAQGVLLNLVDMLVTEINRLMAENEELKRENITH